MYTLKVTTNYHTPLNYVSYVGKGESGSVHKGMPATFKNLGNFRVTMPGAGEGRDDAGRVRQLHLTCLSRRA
mgnify:CR=1 FL=1